jgi:hypothetical protein
VRRNLLGKLVGRLTVIADAGIPRKPWHTRETESAWFCRCKCGTEKILWASWLTRRRVVSCGCLQREKAAEIALLMGKGNTTHGMSHTPTHHSWCAMLQRCGNPKDSHWEDYGGRGIFVCARWTSFANFFEDLGKRPEGRTLDRIDVDKGYNKANCRWAGASVQVLNRRPPSEWKLAEDEEEFY